MKPEIPYKVPSDYEPNDNVLTMANRLGIDKAFINAEKIKFIFWFQEKGVRRCGWDRSFGNWIQKAWDRKQSKNKAGVPIRQWEGERIEKSVNKPDMAKLKQMIYGG